LLLVLAALVIAAAVVWVGLQITGAVRDLRRDATRDRALRLLDVFAPAVAGADRDVRTMLVWHPIAGAARRMCPDEFAILDRATGATFPFSADQLQMAHARWTAEWLAWEHMHDVEYKLKTAAVDQEINASGGSPLARARFDAIEREKLELYQRRYEEYIRTAKALQALIP
jgi:hypothetical protein